VTEDMPGPMTAFSPFGIGGPGGGRSATGRALAPSVFPPPESMRPTLRGTRGLVVAGHPIAAQVAANVLEAGGNAIDAGVAGGLALTVVNGDMCSLGGIAPIVLRRAGESTVWSVGGVGPWSTTASIEAYVARHGTAMPPGVAPVVVPGSPAAWLAALAHGGTWRFDDVARPAWELASDGFALDAVVAAGLEVFGRTFRQWPSTTAVFWPDGAPPPVGTVLRQPDLAAVLGGLVDAAGGVTDRVDGIEAARARFYEGPIARTMVDWVGEHGGFLTLEDLSRYRAEVTLAPSRRYRGLTVSTTSTWSQGPMLLQALAILERFDLGTLEPGSADLLHLVVEAFTLAAADRERYYGDPAQVSVPLERLLSDARADELAARIRSDTSLPNLGGDGVRSTTHLSVVDAAGNAFSVAPSDTLAFGPVCPGLGFVVSPRGIQSRLDPDHPAALGPGRRPRITPAPAIALDATGNPWALSCPGGDVIVQAMLQVIVAAHDHLLTPQQAVEAPRVCALTFPNSFHPHGQIEGQVCVEGRIAESVRGDLERRGHRVQDWPDWEFDAGSVALVRLRPDGTLDAGADPRRAAYAAGR
jgi:gamma-glutamyltranspeptidase/glutathione hydrolase